MKNFTLLLATLIFFSFSGYSQSIFLYAGTPQTSGTDPVVNPPDRLSSTLNGPFSLAFDSKGNLYISETNNNRIRMIYPADNKCYTRAGNSKGFANGAGVAAEFYSPEGIAIGLADTLLVADYANNCIRKVDPFTTLGNSQYVRTFAGVPGNGGFADGGPSKAKFNGPTALAVDASGNVYVSDAGNNVIRKITPNGVVSTIAGKAGQSGSNNGSALNATFNNPTGLFLAPNGDLYIADNSNSCIRLLHNGQVSTYLSGLWTPNDLVILQTGEMYITDKNRIWKYYNSNLGTFAGSSDVNVSGYQEGNVGTSLFNNVQGIIHTSSNNELWVADMDNQVIRYINFTPKPVAAFSSSTTVIKVNQSINFTDNSTNSPNAWHWIFQGGNPATSNAQNPLSITYTTAGTYDVTLIATNTGGSDTLVKAGYIKVNISGIDENKSLMFSMYPNPVVDKLNIELLDKGNEQINISISDLAGKIVKSSTLKNTNKAEIDVNSLLPGIYFVSITINSETTRVKMIKQ